MLFNFFARSLLLLDDGSALAFYFVIFAFIWRPGCQLFYNKQGGERKQQQKKLIRAKNVSALALAEKGLVFDGLFIIA